VALKSKILKIEMHLLDLIITFEKVNIIGVNISKMIIQAQPHLDLALKCEHNLTGRQPPKIHPRQFVKLI
jgi:hypothetical protein